MKLVKNIPLDTRKMAGLITDRDDLHLVWPLAKFPFDHDQWEGVLDPRLGNVPFWVYEDDRLIGHAALCITDAPHVYSVSFLYLLPELRSQGLGEKMVGLMEEYAKRRLHAKKLVLNVRTHNPRARQCYGKCGFQELFREGSLTRMVKTL